VIDHLGIIVASALVTFGTRYAGFALDQRRFTPSFGRFLTYIPVAVFAALIAPDLGIGTTELPARLIGIAAASIAVWLTRQLWAGLAAGMIVFWLTRGIGLS
jgi:branched-subunit amino acid transport protein